MSDFYRERDRLVGGTANPWNSHTDMSLSALDQDGDSEDTTDANAARTTSGTLSQADLAQ